MGVPSGATCAATAALPGRAPHVARPASLAPEPRSLLWGHFCSKQNGNCTPAFEAKVFAGLGRRRAPPPRWRSLPTSFAFRAPPPKRLTGPANSEAANRGIVSHRLRKRGSRLPSALLTRVRAPFPGPSCWLPHRCSLYTRPHVCWLPVSRIHTRHETEVSASWTPVYMVALVIRCG